MKHNKDIERWVAKRHKNITNMIERAYGFPISETTQPIKPPKKERQLEYLCDSYFPTGDESYKKPPPPEFILN
jgi:hypothetical protein